MTKPIRIALAGEALIDLIASSDGAFTPCLGGAVYNLARALSRQGVGSMYLNPLSSDRFGRLLAQQLEQDGVALAKPNAAQGGAVRL
jgi:fructokinase